MDIVDKLVAAQGLDDSELAFLIGTDKYDNALRSAADKVRREIYGNRVFIRGLIEFTNYCKNNCYYCGIRKGNAKAVRYRLSEDDILKCCSEGYALGFRTFVLQGGEDPFFADDKICSIVSAIRSKYEDCAITLSIGEKSRKSYQAYFDAGADRYLLRHETACESHYMKLHPESQRLADRKECLFSLKEIGYEVGSGFMVGSPFQSTEDLVADIRFLQELQPDMIGIGPFIPHSGTPFRDYPGGSLQLTLRMISILRLLFPGALIPSTTALATISENGRELGLKAGANVLMPNLSPIEVRAKYSLYNNKVHSGAESAGNLAALRRIVSEAGYEISTARGDSLTHSGRAALRHG